MDKKDIHELLSMPNDEIGKLVNEGKLRNVSLVAQEANGIAQRAVWLAEYLEWRGVAGCGEHTHEVANREADKKLKAVRKAMGYSYP